MNRATGREVDKENTDSTGVTINTIGTISTRVNPQILSGYIVEIQVLAFQVVLIAHLFHIANSSSIESHILFKTSQHNECFQISIGGGNRHILIVDK